MDSLLREDFLDFREQVRGVMRDIMEKASSMHGWLLETVAQELHKLVYVPDKKGHDDGYESHPCISADHWVQCEVFFHGLSAVSKFVFNPAKDDLLPLQVCDFDCLEF